MTRQGLPLLPAVTRRLLLVCLALGAPLAIQEAAKSSVSGDPASPRYRLTDLGTTKGGYFSPRDINESGVVVGEIVSRNAAIWKPTTTNGPDGIITSMGAVSGLPFTYFAANNDAGVSVGEAYASSTEGGLGNRGFRRVNSGQVTTFPDEGGFILDINSAGVCVGGAKDAGSTVGTVFTGPEIGFLPTLDGRWGWARGINDNGVIVGNSLLTVGFGTAQRAVLWVDHQIENIHANMLPPEAVDSRAVAINNLDHIVGTATHSDTSTHGYLWANGVATDLGTLPGGNCVPDDINDSDAIVGTAGTAAFIDEGSDPVDLNTLIAPGGQYHLETATGINNKGQIVGTAFFTGSGNIRGVLLTPYTLLKADLSVTLAAAPNPVVVGHDLTYSGKVKNSGPQSASPVTATFTLPENVELISTTPDATREGDVLTFALGTLNNQQIADVQVVVRPNAAGSLTTSLHAQAPENDITPLNNEASKVVTAKSASADLIVTGTDTPDPIAVGQVLTYKITVKNLGPDSANNARMVVPVDGLTSFQSAESTKGTVSHQGPNAVAEIGALARGESTLVTVTMLAVTAGNVASGAIATSDETDPNPNNNLVTLSTTIRGIAADLSVTGTDSPDPVTVGQTLTYKITVKNNGPDSATGARMVVPTGGSQFVSVETTKGTASLQGANVVAEIGELAKGETALITVVLTALTSGDHVNGAIVTATEADPNLNNNIANLATTIKAPPQPNLIGHWDELKALKTGRRKNVKYVISAAAKVTNNGNAAAGTTKLRFFISSDRVKSDDDVALTIRVQRQMVPLELPVVALAAGASSTLRTGVTLSKSSFNSKLKGKFLLGVVDFAGTVAESNEADNVFPRDGDKVNPF